MAKKIVIDAGHGGSDPGTSANGIVEKDYTLKISKYLKNRFDDLGIESALTRTGDETLGPKERPNRVQSFYGNGSDVIVLSNHINAGGGDGAEIIYSLRNSDALSKSIANEFIKSGQNVRKYYQRRLPSDPSKDYYYILRDTPNNESIIIEYGFADSGADDPSLIKNNWEDLAEAVVRGVANYLKVPYQPIEGSNTYVVKKGDTLWQLARQFNTTVDQIKEANNLTSNSLSIGQVLIIPGLNEDVDSDENEYYIVKKGDTLYQISQKYGLSVDELKRLNNLSSNSLTIGQRLLVKKGIPSSTTYDTYTVKKGDSLYQIAQMYNTSVDEIKSLNNLSSNLLSIGQVLKIPSSSISNDNIIYTVVAGDNLYRIAQRYNVSLEQLRKLNNLNTDNLSIGQKLLIPS